ncbi:MAG: hypothetical protein NZV14_17005 [Bryobacteraceae bacterium]|nr:hypothetical protein [Bryobacteraceae bacterium]MDW8379862.1 hypothetical protein [Bryobacterales bacterium]
MLRAIFRICYNRYRELAVKEKYLTKATLEMSASHHRRTVWGRRDEEYLADFYLVSKRHLNEIEWGVFRYYFLLGADWKLCCSRLSLDRGNFFHMVYRIEQKLGLVFRELEPFPLFPLDEYFYGTTRTPVQANTPRPVAEARPSISKPRRVTPIRPPVTEEKPADLPDQKAA